MIAYGLAHAMLQTLCCVPYGGFCFSLRTKPTLGLSSNKCVCVCVWGGTCRLLALLQVSVHPQLNLRSAVLRNNPVRARESGFVLRRLIPHVCMLCGCVLTLHATSFFSWCSDPPPGKEKKGNEKENALPKADVPLVTPRELCSPRWL